MELESEYVTIISALAESESLMVDDDDGVDAVDGVDDVVDGVVDVDRIEVIVLLALVVASLFKGVLVVSVVLTTPSSLR